MNNEKIIETYNEFDESLFKKPFLEKQLGDTEEVLNAIMGLKRNEFYQKLKKFLLDDRFKNLSKILRSEKDPVKMYRIQGKLDELENFVDLEKLREIYQQTHDYLKGQLNKK